MRMRSSNPSIPTPVIAIGITPIMEFFCFLHVPSFPEATNSLVFRYIHWHKALLFLAVCAQHSIHLSASQIAIGRLGCQLDGFD
jgi:hypothetical protein